jgi:hypothetical protein
MTKTNSKIVFRKLKIIVWNIIGIPPTPQIVNN